jgi:lipoate-protein ligase A
MTPSLERRSGAEYVALADDLAARATTGAVMAASVLEPATLVLGSAQRDDAADAAACAAAGIDVVRRGTGGGAVFCNAGVLLVDLAVPRGHPFGPDDVTEAYRPLGEAIVRALGGLGVGARTVTVDEARATDDAQRGAARRACWAGLSPYEVVLPDGRKLVGLAQRRRAGTVVHQVAIHVFTRPEAVADLLVDGADLAPWLASTACLADVVDVTVEETWAALAGVLRGRT